MAKKRRMYRVAERVQEITANELLRASDPRLSLVTITSVVVSADLRHAKIYWVVGGDDERKNQAQDAFNAAEGYFRSAVGKELGLRFTPALRFFYDDTLDTYEEIDKLLKQLPETQTVEE